MPGKPKPTKLKVLEGNPGKRKLPEDEPKPRPIKPEVPEWLSKRGKEIFERECIKFHRVGLLTETDGNHFAAMCQTLAYLEEVIKAREESELLALKHTVDGAGNEHVEAKINPLQVEYRLLAGLFRGYAAEFGATPRGRVGLQIGKRESEDGADLI